MKFGQNEEHSLQKKCKTSVVWVATSQPSRQAFSAALWRQDQLSFFWFFLRCWEWINSRVGMTPGSYRTSLKPLQHLLNHNVAVQVTIPNTVCEFDWAMVKIGAWACAGSVKASACGCDPHQSSMNGKMRLLQLPWLDYIESLLVIFGMKKCLDFLTWK